MTTTVSLPWPPSELSPNGSHGHWAKRARAKKSYRRACFLTALSQVAKPPRGTRFDLSLVFIPPTRRKYDRDNLVARMKSGLDGLAEAWRIDDSAFVRVTAEIAEGPGAGAEVRVEVREHIERGALADLGDAGLPARARQ